MSDPCDILSTNEKPMQCELAYKMFRIGDFPAKTNRFESKISNLGKSHISPIKPYFVHIDNAGDTFSYCLYATSLGMLHVQKNG